MEKRGKVGPPELPPPSRDSRQRGAGPGLWRAWGSGGRQMPGRGVGPLGKRHSHFLISRKDKHEQTRGVPSTVPGQTPRLAAGPRELPATTAPALLCLRPRALRQQPGEARRPLPVRLHGRHRPGGTCCPHGRGPSGRPCPGTGCPAPDPWPPPAVPPLGARPPRTFCTCNAPHPRARLVNPQHGRKTEGDYTYHRHIVTFPKRDLDTGEIKFTWSPPMSLRD